MSTGDAPAHAAHPEAHLVEVGPLREEECAAVAALHERFFGEGRGDGHSIAMLGRRFLEHAFYRANFDNPDFFVDVARYKGEIFAFSVYCSNHRRVFRHTLRRHPLLLAREVAWSTVRHPVRTTKKLLGNLAFLTESLPPETREIGGWYLLLGIEAEYRTREFREKTGVRITDVFREHLHRVLRERGCTHYWAAPAVENEMAIAFYERVRAEPFAEAPVQGVLCRFYRLSTAPEG